MATATPAGAYPDQFYAVRASGSRRSADAVADVLVALGLGPFPRALDVGCGRGDWLRAFVARGTQRAVGLDGSWNVRAFGHGDPVEFREVDLGTASSSDLDRLVPEHRFDIAISVEAVEHLPPDAGARVVDLLVERSDLVVFSGAVPGQGGRMHQNEQWQSQWAEKFAAHGFEPYDLLRPVLWSRDDVEPWYRQNVLVYAPRPPLPELPPASASSLDLVHPGVFEQRRRELSGAELLQAARDLGRRRLRGLARRIGR